ncbi:MAG TPA: GNAT family N-acetyltransferase [Methanocorpusculum sp.]|nr:GNAT family N-acetyltransferase [Methanocorpusculum sp.]
MKREKEKIVKPIHLARDNREIVYRAIRNWNESEIVDIYRAGGWWEMGWDITNITSLIHGSFLFIIAIDVTTGHAIGMGRIIADGTSDGYIQDVAVLHHYRKLGIGTTIVTLLRSLGNALGLSWLGLISAPGKENIYKHAGFSIMKNYTPMNIDDERKNRYQ